MTCTQVSVELPTPQRDPIGLLSCSRCDSPYPEMAVVAAGEDPETALCLGCARFLRPTLSEASVASLSDGGARGMVHIRGLLH